MPKQHFPFCARVCLFVRTSAPSLWTIYFSAQQCVCTSSEGFDGFLSDKLFLLAADHKINKKAQQQFNSLPEALSHVHTETLSERQLSACYGSTVEGFLLKLIQWLQPLDWSRGDKCTHIQELKSRKIQLQQVSLQLFMKICLPRGYKALLCTWGHIGAFRVKCLFPNFTKCVLIFTREGMIGQGEGGG